MRISLLSVLAAVVSPVLLVASPVPNHPGSAPILLGVDSVRKELRLSSLQCAVLDSLRAEYKASARKLTDPMPSTSAERAAAQAKLEILTARTNERALSALSSTQRRRFIEIECQVLGGTMLRVPKVQQKLGLDTKQLDSITKIHAKEVASAGKINHRFEDGKISHQERVQLLRKTRTTQAAAMLKVLTPKQRTEFDAMRGAKFAI